MSYALIRKKASCQSLIANDAEELPSCPKLPEYRERLGRRLVRIPSGRPRSPASVVLSCSVRQLFGQVEPAGCFAPIAAGVVLCSRCHKRTLPEARAPALLFPEDLGIAEGAPN